MPQLFFEQLTEEPLIVHKNKGKENDGKEMPSNSERLWKEKECRFA